MADSVNIVAEIFFFCVYRVFFLMNGLSYIYALLCLVWKTR